MKSKKIKKIEYMLHKKMDLGKLTCFSSQEDKRTEVATGLSEKFSKNPEYYSRFDTTFHDKNHSQK